MKIIKTASGKKSIKISKSEWQSIGKKAGWIKSAEVEGADDIKQKIDAIRASTDRPQKIQDLLALYGEVHPDASKYEFNTLWNDLGQKSLEAINTYIDEYVYQWGGESEGDGDKVDVRTEEDCFIEVSGRLGSKYSVSCGGKFIQEVSNLDQALEVINKWQNENQFYPNVWMINDHGNIDLIDNKGNIIS